MKKEPDIIKILREEEKLNLLSCSDISSYQDEHVEDDFLDEEKNEKNLGYSSINIDDNDAITYLKFFTLLSQSEICSLEEAVSTSPEKREAQRKLAQEVTRLVHGEAALAKAERASRVLFGEAISDISDRDLEAIFRDVPGAEIGREKLKSGMGMIDLMAQSGLVKSKGEARRMIKQGGAYLNNVRIESEEKEVSLNDLASESMLVLRSGKKKYLLVKLTD